MTKNRIRQSVAAWNNRFPLDRWWRKKYNVSYLSNVHRESSFYSMYFEFYEDLMFKEYKDKKNNEEETEQSEYIPMTNSWWKGKELSKKEIDEWFKTPL